MITVEIALSNTLVFILRWLGRGWWWWRGREVNRLVQRFGGNIARTHEWIQQGRRMWYQRWVLCSWPVSGGMNTWLAASHCPGPFLATLPAPAFQHPAPPLPTPTPVMLRDISSLLGLSGRVAALFAKSAQWEGGNHFSLSNNPPPRPFSLKPWLSHLQFWKLFKGRMGWLHQR